jgi:hypothetical protein
LNKLVNPSETLVVAVETLDVVDVMLLNSLIDRMELTVDKELLLTTNPLEPDTKPAANEFLYDASSLLVFKAV